VSSYGTEAWSNPGNITANDTVVAECLIGGGAAGADTPTQYLRASSFGFDSGGDAVPSGATIDGYAVRVRATDPAGSMVVEFDRVRLVDASGNVTATEGSASEVLDGAATDYDFGGATDTWGGTISSADDVRDADFGSVTSLKWTGSPFGNSTVEVDSVSITVYWTAGSPPTDDAARIRRYRHLDRMRRQTAWF